MALRRRTGRRRADQEVGDLTPTETSEEAINTSEEEPTQSAPTAAEVAMAELADRCTTLADQLSHVRGDEGGMLAALPAGDHFVDLGEASRSPVVRHAHQSSANFVNTGAALVHEAALQGCRAREAAARLLPGAVRRIGDSGAMVEAQADEAGALLRDAAEHFERARAALAAHRAPPPKRCPTCRQVVPT